MEFAGFGVVESEEEVRLLGDLLELDLGGGSEGRGEEGDGSGCR